MQISSRLHRLFSAGLLCLLTLMMCGCKHKQVRQTESVKDSVPDIQIIADEWADSMTSTLSDEEIVGQLFMPAVYSRIEERDIRMLRYYADTLHVGGILLLQGYSTDAATVADTFNRMSIIPPWISIDAEWGLGMRLKDAPVFPRNAYLPYEPQLMREYGEEIARECRLTGINMVMGPVVDVAGKNTFIGTRSYGEDPQRVADLGVAYAEGLESGGVVSVAKHFPGHGHGLTDSHKQAPVNEFSRECLEKTSLYPFRRIADKELTGIMAGHIAVPTLDSTMAPATISQMVLTGLLREDIGFKGLIITDALNMGGAAGQRAADAVSAGADIILAPASTEEEIKEILKRMRSGELSKNVVAERCRRVLKYKCLFRVCGPSRWQRPRHSSHTLPELLRFSTDTLISRLYSPTPRISDGNKKR